MNKVIAAVVAGVIIAICIGVGVWWYYSHSVAPAKSYASTPTGKEYLIVGTSPDFPPFEYVAKNGSIVGFDIDLIRLLAHKIGYKGIKIVSMDFDSLIPALLHGKIDVIAAGMSITPQREKVVAFTIPYWHADQAVLIRANSKWVPKSLEDLKGKTVGVETGTTGAEYIKKYASKLGINVKEYSSFVLAVQDLVNGRIDAVVLDSPVAKMFTSKYPVKIAFIIHTGEVYGFAVRKSDVKLLHALDQALKEVLNSTAYKKLVEKYFGG
ncbi:MAG: basic amino acid ABC transporter substrate-binding protein [Crenarchaeota archaeon]|nr:basic amino acid ABC transporter substrate-binding protein [Thermoproteota archaeon]